MAEFPPNIGKKIQESESDRKKVQVDWDLSIEFLSGNQWMRYDRRIRDFLTIGTGQDTRVTVNLLLNIYRNMLSRLAIAYPSMVAMPASPSTEDILKAKASETALRYYWAEDNVRGTIEQALEWLLTTGTTALHTYFDSVTKSVTTVAHSPYDVVFEPKINSPDEAQWIAIRTFHTKEALKKAYPDVSQFIEKAPETQYDASVWGEHKPGNRLELYEVYWRDGRHAFVLNNKYLFKESLKLKIFPIQIIRYTRVPSQLWGLGLLRPLLELQAYYNKARTQMLMNVELMGNPKWIVPKNSGIPKGAFTNRPGEIIYYNIAGGPPTQLQAAPLPGYVMDNVQRIHSEMGDVAGIHSVSLGRRAVGISSGKAIDALSERDMSQLQITQAGIEAAVRKMAKCVLSQMKVYYNESKFMRMMDDTGQVVFHELKTTDLMENPEIFLEAGSLFRHESGDRDRKIVELLQMGLIDKEDALKELSFRTGNSFVTDKMQAMAHAQDILKRAAAGYEVEILRTDDLPVFKDVFHKFMQSDGFYELDEERQEYITEVLISIETFGLGDEAFQQAAMMRKVFPRQSPPGQVAENAPGMLAAADSPMTQEQLAREQLSTVGDKNTVDLAQARQAKGSEALMSPQKYGGTL
jgi:hypothetical protein